MFYFFFSFFCFCFFQYSFAKCQELNLKAWHRRWDGGQP